MNADEIRALQAPLKETYRDHPDPAIVTLRAEGDLDFRGTLGVSKEAPAGFRARRLVFDLDAQASEEELAKRVELTERYCVVLQTLRSPAALHVTKRRTPCL